MRKTFICIVFLSIQVYAYGQIKVQSEDYMTLKVGTYKSRSLEQNLIGENLKQIQPNRKFTKNQNVAFIKVDTPINLFDLVNDKGTQKAIGILSKSSVVEVDTIFYQEIYQDTTQEWHLTFNVWYAIKINGETYYTDLKIHDFIAFEHYLDEFKQKFLLIAQSTGYDFYYDLGYPNYFFVVILNSNNEFIFESNVLDFDYGDEYWEPDYVQIETNSKPGFKFTIEGIQNKITAIWTGEKLIEN